MQPHAITLDINLPDIDGWRVLDRLKDDLATRHIPVQIVTTEEDRERGLRMGAMGVLTKPVRTRDVLDETFARDQAVHRAARPGVLLIDGARSNAGNWHELLGGDDVTSRPSAPPPMRWPRSTDGQTFDVVIIGLELPDKAASTSSTSSRRAGAARRAGDRLLAADLTKKEETHLKRLGQTHGAQGRALPERLVDEAALFLHRRVARSCRRNVSRCSSSCTTPAPCWPARKC